MFSLFSIRLKTERGPGQYVYVFPAFSFLSMIQDLPNEPKYKESMILPLLTWLRISLLNAVQILEICLSWSLYWSAVREPPVCNRSTVELFLLFLPRGLDNI